MSDISVVKKAEDQASKALQVTVPVDRVRAAEGRAVKLYASRARIPGFRKGKAPEAVVRKRFSDEIRQMVLQDVIHEGWDAARAAENLEPIGDPSVRNVKFEEGQPVEFELFVEVRPEVTVERLGGFTVTREVPPVTDEQVAAQLEALREDKAAWLPVEGAPPAPGHLVRGEVASIEGETVHAAKPFSLVLGTGEAIPDLEARLMAMAPGDTADAVVRFPDDDPDEARRGQARSVRLTLHEVKRKELPPLDDALAREVGPFETLEALRAAVRADLEREAGRQADAAVREQLISLVAEANGVIPPPSLVERTLHALGHAYGIPPERFEAFATQFRPVAMQQVRRDLIVTAVAERESLRASEAEVDARIAEIAERRGSTPAAVYASLQEAKRLPELARSLTEEKVFAFLHSQSTVTQEPS